MNGTRKIQGGRFRKNAIIPFAMVLMTAVVGRAQVRPGGLQLDDPPGGPGTGTVGLHTYPLLEDSDFIQSDRVTESLGDRNRALLYSGEFVHEFVDFELPGRGGLDIHWKRTYRSRLVYDGPVGQGWTHTYNEFVRRVGFQVLYYTGSGEIIPFYRVPGTTRFYRSGLGVIERRTDTTYQLVSNASETREFGPEGPAAISRLESILSRDQNQVDLEYDSLGRLDKIVDSLGRETLVEYYATNRISRVIDPTGRVWDYRYTNGDNLRSVTIPIKVPDETYYDYRYFGGTSKMKKCLYPEGERFSNTYNGLGELLTHTRGAGSWQFDYSFLAFDRLAEVTDRNGNLSTYRMSYGSPGNAPDGILKEETVSMNRGIDPNAPPSYTTQHSSVDAPSLGRYSKAEYPDGRVYWRLWDKFNVFGHVRGNVREERMDPDGGGVAQRSWFIHETRFNEVKYSVSPEAFRSGSVPLVGLAYKQLDLTDPEVAAHLTERVFDYEEVDDSTDYNGDGIIGPEHGKIVKTIYPQTSAQSVNAEQFLHYNLVGQLLERIDPRGSRIRFFYWPESDPLGLDPLSVPVSDHATAGGLLAKVIEDYSEDPAKIDPQTGAAHRNLTTIRHYDQWGNVAREISPRGDETLFEWNKRGELVKEIHGGNDPWEVRRFYDDNGSEIREIVEYRHADGTLDLDNPWVETKRSYDATGLLVAVESEVAEGVFETERFYYDKNENLVLAQSPLGEAGVDSDAIRSWVHDERDSVHTETHGGVTDQFLQIAAHDHLDFAALGLAVNPDASTVTTSYSFGGVPVLEQSPDDEDYMTQLDGFGRPHVEEGPGMNRTEYEYNLEGSVVCRRSFGADNSLQSEETWDYDERNEEISRSVTYFQVDASGQSTPIVTDGNADGVATYSTQRDLSGGVASTTNDRGETTQQFSDGVGHVYRVVNPDGSEELFTRDGSGNALKHTRVSASGGTERALIREFDGGGRVLSTADEVSIVTYEYDSLGRMETRTDPLGNVVRFSYDGRGRLVHRSEELTDSGTGSGSVVGSSDVQQEFDSNGRRVSFSDGMDRVITFGFDARDNVSSTQVDAGPALTATHSALGKVEDAVDPNGNSIRHHYNEQGFLSSIEVLSFGAGVDNAVSLISYDYDEFGKLLFADNGVCQVRQTRDSLGNLTSETLTIDGVDYTTTVTYDGDHFPVSVVYPSGMVVTNQQLANDGLIDIVQVDGVTQLDHQFELGDVIGRTTTPAVGGVFQLTRSLDASGGVIGLQHDVMSTPGVELEWDIARDPMGLKAHVVRVHEGKGDQFRYDSQYQLKEARIGVAESEIHDFLATAEKEWRFEFDLARNRTLREEDLAQTDYDINRRNQISSVDTQGLTYDNNGNLTHDGVLTYIYGFDNSLRQVWGPGGLLVEYFYDPLGRRVKKSTSGEDRIEVWFSARLMETHSTTTPTLVEFVYGRDLDDVAMLRVDGEDHYVFRDEQNSAVWVVDDTGALAESYEYTPDGYPTVFNPSGREIRSTRIGNPLLFTGRMWDHECGLYHMRGRYYSPELSRFVSSDPIGLQGGMNLYTFAGNNPVNGRDPHGTTTWEDLKRLADPQGVHKRAMDYWDNRAKDWAVWGILTPVRELVGYFTKGGGIAKITKGKLDAEAALFRDLGPAAVDFMNNVSESAAQVRALADIMSTVNKVLEFFGADTSAGLPVTIDGIQGTITFHEWDGSYHIEMDNGMVIDGDDLGNMTAKIPAGSAGSDCYTRNSYTGVETYRTADGKVEMIRYPDGSVTVKLSNGTTFVYDEKGKLIKRLKPGEECPDATDEPDDDDDDEPVEDED